MPTPEDLEGMKRQSELFNSAFLSPEERERIKAEEKERADRLAALFEGHEKKFDDALSRELLYR